jgi:hypothetical protein
VAPRTIRSGPRAHWTKTPSFRFRRLSASTAGPAVPHVFLSFLFFSFSSFPFSFSFFFFQLFSFLISE